MLKLNACIRSRFRYWSFNKVVVFLCFSLIVYNEFLVYYIYWFRWPSNTCGIDFREPHRILLVADPQILGENDESLVARWDCDRYLKNTFDLAVSYVDPAMVIFLGDLMDEGNVATNEQFRRYFDRFQRIFRINTSKRKALFIPGDNDIGGEDDPVTSEKLNRFAKYFGNTPSEHQFKNIRFIETNVMLRVYPKGSLNTTVSGLRVVISHIPLLGSPSSFSDEVLTKIRPHLIVSAHDHKSVHFVGNLENGDRTFVEHLTQNPRAPDKPPHWRFQTTSKSFTNELVVPTASYRMGVTDPAYGVLLFDNNLETVCYNVLWLPQRLDNLMLYVFSLPIIILAVVFHRYVGCRRNLITRATRTAHLPL